MSRDDFNNIILLFTVSILAAIAQLARILLDHKEISWRYIVGGILGAIVTSLVFGSLALYVWFEKVNIFLLIPIAGIVGWVGGELLGWAANLGKAWVRNRAGTEKK